MDYTLRQAREETLVVNLFRARSNTLFTRCDKNQIEIRLVTQLETTQLAVG